ncbi:ketopantoate reductase family protein [Bacillota bacterium Lsc_1132]
MKIGIAGTGAVGGYFGGQLKLAGNDVIFLAREKKLTKLLENGLTIKGEAASFHVDGDFTGRYEDFSDVDLLLFCVKSNATKEVASLMAAFLKKECLILTLQNGVDNEEILAEMFGKQWVMAAATYIQAEEEEPVFIRQIGLNPRLVIGALDESTDGKVMDIVKIFNTAGIKTISTADVLEIKWKKLLWNITFNPLTALIESKVGAIYESKCLQETAVKVCKEAIAVARKNGIDIDENFYEKIIEQGKLAVNHQTSMLQDKLKGKPMELESICGYVIRKGKEFGVETPVLETIYHLLSYQSLGKKNF